jgi:diguanylate cyclase (GGDEF)-like protein
MSGGDRVGSGSYVLFINIAMAGIVASVFLFAFLHDRRRVQTLCWLAACGLVIINGAIEAAAPQLISNALLRVTAFSCFLAAIGLLGLGFSHQYKVKYPLGPAITIYVGAIFVNIAILDMARNSALRLYLYHGPYFLMGCLAALMVLRAREKTFLEYLLFTVVALLDLHFLMRPVTSRMLGGVGDSAGAYLATPYGAFDQTALAILTMSMAALLSLMLVRDIIRGLTKVSVTDPLSGLLNRRGFLEKARPFIDASRGAGRNVFLVIADIDHFKLVNDTHGHETGDGVIQAFGLLLETLAAAGTSVARIGGEEFALMFNAPNIALARLYCESIRTAAEVGAAGKDEALPRFTVSFGLAALVAGESLESLTRRADLALYSAKQGGRNRVAIAEPIVSESLAA